MSDEITTNDRIAQFAIDICRLYMQTKIASSFTNKRHKIDMMQAYHDSLLGLMRRGLIQDYNLLDCNVTVGGVMYTNNTIVTKFIPEGEPMEV